MKKTGIIIIVSVVLALLLGDGLFLYFMMPKETEDTADNSESQIDLSEYIIDVGEFELSRYQEIIDAYAEAYPDVKNVGNIGKIASDRTVVNKAKKLWIAELGEDCDPNGSPIRVSYDSENDCWLVRKTLPYDWLGYVPMALIQNDGKVLAVWWG